MFSYALASSLIAFIATAGAIPLFRSLSRPFQSDRNAESPQVAPAPRAAGAGVLFGVMISLFYLDSSPGSATELLVAGLILVLIGSWLERTSPRHLSPAGHFAIETLASAIVVIVLLFFVSPAEAIQWSLVTFLLILMVVVTPLAVSRLERSALATAALPAAVVLIQLLLLALISALDANDMGGSALHKDIRIIVLPTAGGLIAALIYLSRMPWRSHIGTTTGLATRLCLGLVVSWGALSLAAGFSAQETRAAPLLWVLALPVFELVRSHALPALRSLLRKTTTMSDYAPSGIGYPPASMCIFALILGATGIVLRHLDVPGFWSMLGLIPALFAYLAVPALMPTAARNESSGLVGPQS